MLIEDDVVLCDVLRMYLENEGFRVRAAHDGVEGLAGAIAAQPALVVLDLMLPRMDGVEVCRRLREVSQVPILMLTARSEETDKVRGFMAGTDDYLTKPFSTQEFLMRVRALLRRSGALRSHGAETSTAAGEHMRVFPSLVIDARRYRVERDGVPIVLTPKEFDLLRYLADRAGNVIRREELLQSVWGYALGDDDRTIHTHINRLRAKLETRDRRYIHTVWGIGYKFEVTQV